MYSQNIKLKVDTISPIYVGSGEVIPAGEYIETNSEVEVYSVESIQSSIINPLRFNEFLNKRVNNRRDSLPSLQKLTDNNIVKLIEPDEKIKKANKFNLNGKEIQCMMKSLNSPYIPGSTLKGVIRTAYIFSKISKMPFKELTDLLDRAFKYNRGDIEKALFNFTPFSDLFKHILVDDLYFEENSTVLCKEEIFAKKAQSGSFLNIVESILPNKTSKGSIKVTSNFKYDSQLGDGSIIRNPRNNYKTSYNSKKSLAEDFQVQQLLNMLYDYSEYMLNRELEYYKRADFSEDVRYSLMSQVEKLIKLNDPKGPIVRIGKNTGYLWHTISGYIINEMPEYFRKNKEKFAIVREGMTVSPRFPTSRKYTIYEKEIIAFGYMKVELE